MAYQSPSAQGRVHYIRVSQDRVYAFQRKGPPIVIFDPDGHYLSSWGNGAFLFAHGITIANDIVYLTDRDSSVRLMSAILQPILSIHFWAQ